MSFQLLSFDDLDWEDCDPVILQNTRCPNEVASSKELVTPTFPLDPDYDPADLSSSVSGLHRLQDQQDIISPKTESSEEKVTSPVLREVDERPVTLVLDENLKSGYAASSFPEGPRISGCEVGQPLTVPHSVVCVAGEDVLVNHVSLDHPDDMGKLF